MQLLARRFEADGDVEEAFRLVSREFLHLGKTTILEPNQIA